MTYKEAITCLKRFKYRAIEPAKLEEAIDVVCDALEGRNERANKPAITWQDIPKLIDLTGKTYRYFSDKGRADVSCKELYEEVLRRFNEQK